jgi:Holliday junction DNA helicase RuvA
MIAGLKGKVAAIYSDLVIIDVNGIGFQVFMSTSTLSGLGAIGAVVKLHTHLYLREDSVSLYGFTSLDELNLFQALIGVSGVGPRLALAMLSVMSPKELTMAIATGSIDLLRRVPGVGKKMAERLVLELKDKIGAGLGAVPMAQLAEGSSDVIAALVSLGYSAGEASRAVAALPIDREMSLEEKIKLTLGYFGGM